MLQSREISRLFVAVYFVAFAFALSAEAAPKIRKGKVTKISDGDTIWVQTGRNVENWILNTDEGFFDWSSSKRLKIRMLGMDTPETYLPTPNGVQNQGRWGTAATAKLGELLKLGWTVNVEDHGLDKYKRTLGRVFHRGVDIDLKMVKSGWAATYIICDGKECNENFLENDNVLEYSEACHYAQNHGYGIFNPNDPLEELPFEFRLRVQNRKPNKWVGDIHTLELFDPEDYEEVEVCDRIFFMTKTAATDAGFEY